MSSEDMYERGVADAERGELHPFYYQHYYHYRRGYDQARRRMRRTPLSFLTRRVWLLTIGVVLVVALAVVLGSAFRGSNAEDLASFAAPEAETVAAEPVQPTRTPLFPTAVPSATPAPIVRTLRVGGSAQVANTEGRALRGRAAPGLKAPVRVAFAEGEQVRILEGPVTADGYVWWRVEGRNGAGWAAQQSLEGVVWLVPVE
jgi:hypothetical protein